MNEGKYEMNGQEVHPVEMALAKLLGIGGTFYEATPGEDFDAESELGQDITAFAEFHKRMADTMKQRLNRKLKAIGEKHGVNLAAEYDFGLSIIETEAPEDPT